MIALVLGFLALFQSQANLPDTGTSVQLLHDSLTVQDGEVLNLTDLDSWEFTTDDIEDSTASVRWVRLEQPISNQDAFPDSLWNGFGYFRLKFKVDSTFSHKEAFLRFSSFRNVSAEIYLNDKSVQKIGNPSRDKESEEIVARYTGMGQPVNLNPDTEYTLVVKKSYLRYSQYIAFTNLGRVSKPHLFSLSLASPDYVQTGIERSKVNILIAGISVSLIFILSVLYLILYFRVKDQKENLWLVLLMASIGAVALNNFLNGFTIHSYWIGLGLDIFLQNLLTPLAIVLVPLVTHKLLKVQAHIFWKAYVMVGTVLYYMRIDFFGLLTFPLILFISLAGGLIAIYKASKQGVRDTFIPALSILGVPLVVIVGLSLEYFGFSGVYFVPVLTLFLYNTLPVGLSIYQGKKFLRLNTEMEDMVKERTNQLEIANKQLVESLSDLKSTQAQLIQSEKMASLGELTAGIAHEIQNPLNFVNNFSEVSAELVEEIKETRIKSQETRPKTEEDEIEDGILEDIKKNLEKINHHGKRADAIVKGMLEHSRTGSGEKEPTVINTLVGEYLNLTYQSFKSKNEGVDIKLITDLDSTIPKIELVRADIGKVLLNILNNAFYACTSTSISTDTSKSDVPLNHPTVGITTKNLGDSIQISISDNGPGIPDSIKDKIFQPFFTTKPTGSGTGLGLSLSYDIVKAHGGEIRVESKEGEETTFIISLPIKINK